MKNITSNFKVPSTSAVILISIMSASTAAALTAPGAPTGWGTVLGSSPVTVFSNGKPGWWSAVRNPVTVKVNGKDKTFNGGIAYQCGELTQRACILRFASDPGGPNAVDWWSNTKYFQRNPDNGTVKPAVGDIVVWSGGADKYGHVAIIIAVGTTSVTLAEQNVLCNAVQRSGNTVTRSDAFHIATMTVKKNAKGVATYQIDSYAPNSKGGYTTLGWLRKL